MALPLIVAGIGMGANLIMNYSRMRKADRALARMGKRPEVTVPKQIMDAYNKRKQKSTEYQGFTNAEINAAQRLITAGNAGLQQKMQNLGGSAQAMQTLFGNQTANANIAMAAQSARMNRAGQANDLAAADALASNIGQYQTMNEQQSGRLWDSQVAGYGDAKRKSKEEMSRLFSNMAGLGMQAAFKGYSGGGGGGNNYSEGTSSGFDSIGTDDGSSDQFGNSVV
jgi:hypothetical protein